MNDDIDLYQSIYKVLMDAQVPETDIDNHYSDLYVRATPQLSLIHIYGGRMMVLNAYGYKYGRIFVPIKVGSEVIRVRYNKVVQEVMLPKDLDYTFDGGYMTISHPSGKREKYKLFTKEQRAELYKEDEKDE